METEGRGTGVLKIIGEEQVSLEFCCSMEGSLVAQAIFTMLRRACDAVSAPADFARDGRPAPTMTQLCQKMSLSNAYRSFAIYLIIVATIAESPVSAFTIGHLRTTTLRPLLDLSGEESALLEVKSDLSKLNNERDNIKYGRNKSTVRNPNYLTPDRQIASTSKKSDITSAPVMILRKHDKPSPIPTVTTIRKEMEISTGFISEKTDTTNTVDGYMSNVPIDGQENIKALAAELNQPDVKTVDNILPKKFVTEENSKANNEQDSLQNKTNENAKSEKHATLTPSTESTENAAFMKEVTETTNSDKVAKGTSTTITKDNYSTTINEEELNTEGSSTSSTESTEIATIMKEVTETTNSDKVTKETSTTITKDNYSTTINKEELNTEGSSTPTVTQNDDTTPQTDAPNSKTESPDDTEEENTATAAIGLTESMIGEASSSSTKNPSWKKYTVIERKRIISTTEAESNSTDGTDKAEELENAESISKITIENAISVTPVHSLEELRQELISNSKTTNTQKDDDSSYTTIAANDILLTDNDQLSSTQPITSDTTKEGNADFLASRRAGYLDFSPKQNLEGKDQATTERLDDSTLFTETELLGSMFEIETQESDGPDVDKNTTMTESQSQLADDAIKEELLREEVLNDQVQQSRRLEGYRNTVKVNPIIKSNDSTEDSLSVKPIAHGKGALYAVNSNYRRMKKIEVQPAKPYVRHPDDNSWRNESLTSLGIVFNANNASKPFTEVLKNKTEAELNNITEKDNKNDVPDLRVRLEKIAEVRKSKKKKIDKFGTVYSDYEESSSETSSTPKTDTVSIPIMEVQGEIFFASLSTSPAPATEATSQRTTTPGVYIYKEKTVTTKKPKKEHKFAEYYDNSDEYDYINLSKIDLKKFTTRLFAKDDTTATTVPALNPFTKPMNTVLPERKPTVQYFPPRGPPQKVNMNDYDSDFQRKVNLYTTDKVTKEALPATFGTPPPATLIQERPAQHYKPNNVLKNIAHQHKPANFEKNIYDNIPPRAAVHNNRYQENNDESFNRASYVIKHYKDFLNEAAKDDYDKSAEFLSTYTEAPLVGVTVNEDKGHPRTQIDQDYNDEFRKDILSRFVENFNQNSERFKADFPILYNNSVVHSKALENGNVVASSSAFMKRLYGRDPPEATAPLFQRPCEPHCEIKVELSPAYELHYYVPDQEEKEEAELKPNTLPYSYSL